MFFSKNDLLLKGFKRKWWGTLRDLRTQEAYQSNVVWGSFIGEILPFEMCNYIIHLY